MVDIRHMNNTALIAGVIILNLVKLVGVLYAGYCVFLSLLVLIIWKKLLLSQSCCFMLL